MVGRLLNCACPPARCMFWHAKVYIAPSTIIGMPKEWLCPTVLGEEDWEGMDCLHCIRLTPPERGDMDHVKTRVVWCNTRLKRVFVRNSDNTKPSRTYQPIGWHCSRCDKLMTLQEYNGLNSERHTLLTTYRQRHEEYYNAVNKGWDWVFEERKRLGWKEEENDSSRRAK